MSIGNDDTQETHVSPTHESDGEEAFLSHFQKNLPDGEDTLAKKRTPSSEEEEPKPKKAKVEEATDDAETEDEDTSEETPEDDEAEEDASKLKKYVEDDETYTKIKIGDEEHEVPVSKLKRLYGQEASLTQKSQAVAARSTAVEAEGAKHAAGLQALLGRAQERAKPYLELDFLALAKDPNISGEELKALRSEAQSRMEEVNFLNSELGNFTQVVQAKQREALVSSAKEAIKQLSDPNHANHVEGWNTEVYDKVRNFAIKEGLDAGTVNNLVDASAIKLIHMAMKYKAGQSKTVTTKVNKTVKKVVKTSNTMSTAQRTGKGGDAAKAAARLKATGSQDDAAKLFMARFKDHDSE